MVQGNTDASGHPDFVTLKHKRRREGPQDVLGEDSRVRRILKTVYKNTQVVTAESVHSIGRPLE